MTRLLLLLALAVPQQSTPTGGAISKYVPPVPTPASFVSDERSVLTASEKASLDARIKAIHDAGLGDVAVAILPSIGSYSPNQVAVEIYRTWKVGSVAAIGSARRNVGVLLLIVPKELAPDKKGQCWINTGTGTEGIITDATAGTICRDEVIPFLRKRDYAGAVGAGIGAIEARLRADEGLAAATSTSQAAATLPQSTSRARFSKGAAVGTSLLALLLVAVTWRKWRRYHRRTCPRCGRNMARLNEQADNVRLKREEQLEESLGSIDYDVWACECGETLTLPYRSFFSKYSECRHCHRRTARSQRHEITEATTVSTGLAEDRYFCHNCKQRWTVEVVLPRIDTSSSSGSSSGGGGGSSFGGSGSTSGGGGGGSY